MARQKLTGIYIPVVTPFNEDESINIAAIDEVAKFLAENGVDGIIPSGSTGEMIAMTKEEQMAVNKAYIQAGHKYGIKVVASTGAYRTGDVIEMSKAAEADGADGVMVVTPWYMGPNKEELYHHYKAIHDSIDISLTTPTTPPCCWTTGSSPRCTTKAASTPSRSARPTCSVSRICAA